MTLTKTEIVTRRDPCDGPGVGTTVQVFNKTAYSAGVTTYSMVSTDSSPVNDPYCFPDLWAPPPYDHQTFPGSTSADWVWDDNIGLWTTGGWFSTDHSCAAGPANQVTGSFSNVCDGNPYATSSGSVT
jgi:hypothetical protein